ncbi:CGI-121-domain-containing protein [Dichomitus squalens LYAD-421 SS1]|uniref:EKC/KEOPS complex subunit CGI121 n=2 Tax=Dichomitus squalens TaxID=114155 RepID=A0A4Q9QBT4_9APHY|nr:CGI-121-domain-containing protein [Dichomitus squalens LYAD-421 SS1]EJF55777.1 CGI-121-domain-containing protein [Dichomitus squalens LYAD-421 SS1]TBU65177.1 CGI-121-domain-containing protein [Dichomitus squalens]
MHTFHYPHLPTELSTVHVALFNNVTNSSEIRSRIVRASQLHGPDGEAEREAVNFAFIDARLICSVLHLQTAVYQAILAQAQDSLRTKTVHSEILWALNPTNNISEAIRRYGVADSTTSLIVVRISSPHLSNVQELMSRVVTGTLSPLEDLSNITDWTTVKKYHKLNTEPALKAVAKDSAQEHIVVNEIVTSTVATKSVSA